MKALLFYREKCPHCPPVKEYMEKHYSGIGVEPVNCDTEKGMEMAKEKWVLSVPSFIMCDDEGKKLWSAGSVKEIRAHENMEENHEQCEHCETCHC